MLGLSTTLRVSLLSALCAAVVQAPASLVFAAPASTPRAAAAAPPTPVASVDELRAQLQAIVVPSVSDIGLDAPADLTHRLVDAELYFALGEYMNCATLLAPALAEASFNTHPGASRARWLVAQSLFETKSLELARSIFQSIVDLRDPTYARDAQMRLLEIAILRRDIPAVERQYAALSSRYGVSLDPEVDFLRARASYFRTNFTEAITLFERIPSTSAYFWRAQYHVGVVRARMGEHDVAMARFAQIESSLTGARLAPEDVEVLNLARLGQGILHYEAQRWDEAIRAYATVDRDSRAFEQAIYQVAWTKIREERYGDAIESLEILALISSNTRLISDARVLAAEMRRRIADYDGALEAYETTWNDFELIRTQLAEIALEEGSAAQRLDATSDILTGTVLASFDYQHWFTNDQTMQSAVSLIREADQLGTWLGDNREIAAEIREALSSGFAFDRVPVLRDTRQRVLEVLDGAVALRAQIVDSARGGGVSEHRSGTERAYREYTQAPKTLAQMDASITHSRDALNDKLLEVYRNEQRLQMEIDNLRATDHMIRDRVRLQLETVAEGQRQRSELRRERDARLQEVRALAAARGALQRRRMRYGIGEAQSSTLHQAKVYQAASDQELNAMGADQLAALRDLRSLEDAIDRVLAELDQRVATAWTTAYRRLTEEEGALATLDGRYGNQRSGDLVGAEQTAMAGYRAMMDEVQGVTLRASLGQVDVAWWQKDVVSRRIDALFRERERQIERLDADFSEIRE